VADIVTFTDEVLKDSADKEVWAFLDEINSCEHLGLISELVCNRALLDLKVGPNVTFLAACNPYRLRKGIMHTPGLKAKARMDLMSPLVYRVHPLPERLIDFVMDYGSLDPADETLYISKMCSDFHEDNRDVLVQALVMSQAFIKEHHSCASLRDVRRALKLVKWFSSRQFSVQMWRSATSVVLLERRALISAFSVCYRARLTTSELRSIYTKKLADIVRNHSQKAGRNTPTMRPERVEAIISCAQDFWVEKMDLDLHKGTAKNEALRENIFVRENLCGPDSKDVYFQSLPQIFVVSYQGSESSTSDGIFQVFERAHRYLQEDGSVIPVVLLDEFGLAEVSPHNPLKILHSLLEPASGKMMVTVVGISNLALDEAKMNRAIHLSRPDPSKQDLLVTAKELW
jgi:hypothetical protein